MLRDEKSSTAIAGGCALGRRNVASRTQAFVLVSEADRYRADLTHLSGLGWDVRLINSADGLREALTHWLASQAGLAVCVVELGPDVPGGLDVFRSFAHQRRVALLAVVRPGDAARADLARALGADGVVVRPAADDALARAAQAAARSLPGASLFPVMRSRLDAEGGVLVTPIGTPVALTPGERSVLKALRAAGGRFLPVHAFPEGAGAGADAAVVNLEAVVARLQRKIGEACPGWTPLRFVEGMGVTLHLDEPVIPMDWMDAPMPCLAVAGGRA